MIRRDDGLTAVLGGPVLERQLLTRIQVNKEIRFKGLMIMIRALRVNLHAKVCTLGLAVVTGDPFENN
jgi:hypothetical protein